MTPEHAAAVLGVEPGAGSPDIERAFQRRARQTHPDVASTPDPEAFAEATRARSVLLTSLGEPVTSAPTYPTYRDLKPGERRLFQPGPPPVPVLPNPWMILLWVGLLLIAAFLSIYDARTPLTIAEPLIRWTVLIGSLVGFALTGRRGFFALAIIAIVATAAVNVALTTIASLIGVLAIAPGALGLLTRGVLVQRRAAALQRLQAEVAAATASDAAP